ncbi:MAG: type II secretion system F family protein, partial [Lentisphaeria bacterium]
EVVIDVSNLRGGLRRAHLQLFHFRLKLAETVHGRPAGQLDGTLDNLAVFLEKADRVRGRVKSALAYPIVIMVIAAVITLFLMTYIIPKFQEIFNKMLEGEPLPLVTEWVIGVSTLLKNHFLALFGGVVLLILFLKFIKKTKKGAYIYDFILLKTPPFNSLIVRATTSRVCRTLGTLMDSGVSVLQALQIAQETSGNAAVSSAMEDVREAVKEGEGMSQPLQSTAVFPPIVISMVEVGEETGELPGMLNRIADVYEEEVDRAVEALTSLLEPITIVLLAVVVGTIVIAMFLPLVTLMQKL